MFLGLDFARLISNLSLPHTLYLSLTYSFCVHVGSQLQDGLINEFQFGLKHDLLKFTQGGWEKQRRGKERRDNHSAAYAGIH